MAQGTPDGEAELAPALDPQRPERGPAHLMGARWRGAVLTAAPALAVLLLGLSEAARLGQDRVAVALVVAQSVPLLWSRSHPWPVLVITAGGHAAQLLLGLPASNAALGHWIAVIAVVAVMRWPWSVVPPVAVFAVDTLLAFGTPGGSGLRDAIILAGLALLSWALGDAVSRRAQVRERLQADSRARVVALSLQARGQALAERVRISEETSRLVGETLDRILVQVRAARPLLGTPAVTTRLATVEEQCRTALGELDRYLALLRRPLRQPEPPTATVSGADDRLAARTPRWAAPAVGHVVALLPTALLLTLALGEALVASGTEPLPVRLLWLPPLQTIPLVLRKAHPVPVLLTVTAAVVGQPLLGYPVFNASLAIPVAAHALAERGPRRTMVVTVTACVLAVALVALARDAESAAQTLLVLLVVSAGACYIGDSSRIARDDDARLVTRLAAAERDEAMRTSARVDADRVAMARELHDGLGHTLAVVAIHAGAARLTAVDDVSARATALDAIERFVLAAFAELDAATPLHAGQAPVGTTSVGDIARLVEHVRATGLSVTLDIDPGAEALPSTVQSAVHRIVQEALTNAVKHAPGSRVTVTVVCGDDVTVRVHNTAATVPVDQRVPSGGRGLTGMRERASLFDGTVSAGPDRTGGYTVEATLPVR